MSINDQKCLVLYGGGIDYTTLLAYLVSGRNARCHVDPATVHLLHFTYDQKAWKQEADALFEFSHRFGIPSDNTHTMGIPYGLFGRSDILEGSADRAADPKKNVVEGRNMVFLSMAATVASRLGIEYLAVGFHHEPEEAPFPDATGPFLDAMNATFRRGMLRPVEIIAPFRYFTRKQIFNEAFLIDPVILEKAHTCYEAVVGGCGECAHCVLKADLLCELAKEKVNELASYLGRQE